MVMQKIHSHTIVLFIAALFVFAAPLARAEDAASKEVQKSAEPEKPAQAPACPNLKPGTFGGIGMIPFMKDDELRVMRVIDGKPADRAGLRIGDQITEIDGKPVKGLTICDVIGLIRGDTGSTVTLKILRKAETLSVPIMREQIQGK